MAQNIFHKNSSFNPPPKKKERISILQRITTAYEIWDSYSQEIPKKSRYTIGGKIDLLFIEIIELVFKASYLKPELKIPLVKETSMELNLLKLFIQILWERKILDNNKYTIISELLDTTGQMLGGWLRQLEKQNPLS